MAGVKLSKKFAIATALRDKFLSSLVKHLLGVALNACVDLVSAAALPSLLAKHQDLSGSGKILGGPAARAHTTRSVSLDYV